ncbi:hypothetical protein R3P38DRAFT_3299220 [Favolaschia claudopus]|uniref:Uncharacterized protein n=1 Tax=Favolaschia claudopus TaxID=2862362 RepID=A0AAV9Z1A4_9AGAR
MFGAHARCIPSRRAFPFVLANAGGRRNHSKQRTIRSAPQSSAHCAYLVIRSPNPSASSLRAATASSVLITHWYISRGGCASTRAHWEGVSAPASCTKSVSFVHRRSWTRRVVPWGGEWKRSCRRRLRPLRGDHAENPRDVDIASAPRRAFSSGCSAFLLAAAGARADNDHIHIEVSLGRGKAGLAFGAGGDLGTRNTGRRKGKTLATYPASLAPASSLWLVLRTLRAYPYPHPPRGSQKPSSTTLLSIPVHNKTNTPPARKNSLAPAPPPRGVATTSRKRRRICLPRWYRSRLQVKQSECE